MNWYLDVLKKYPVFAGRARRKEYWFFTLINLIVAIVLVSIDAMVGTYSAKAGIGLISGLYLLAILLPSIAVAIRRLHDTDRSGWWFLVNFIPFVGPFVFLVFMAFDGTPGANRFGPNPKANPDPKTTSVIVP